MLVDQLFNLLIDRKDDHAEYEVFSTSDMKDMAKVVGDVMRPGAHRPVFRSDLLFLLWYGALALEEQNCKTTTRKIPVRAGLIEKRA